MPRPCAVRVAIRRSDPSMSASSSASVEYSSMEISGADTATNTVGVSHTTNRQANTARREGGIPMSVGRNVVLGAIESIGGGTIGGFLGVVISRNEAGRDDTFCAVPAVLVVYVIVLVIGTSVFSVDEPEQLKQAVREAL